jgi:hypothetical protein
MNGDVSRIAMAFESKDIDCASKFDGFSIFLRPRSTSARDGLSFFSDLIAKVFKVS